LAARDVHSAAIGLVAGHAGTGRLLAARGLPVPAQRVFARADPGPAEAFLAAAGGPVVVKPLGGTGGGRGVTTGIESPAALRRAVRHAGRFGPRLLVERHVPGASWRLTYLDGRLLDAVRRDPPAVTGDGRSTIRALIAAENRRRRAAVSPAGPPGAPPAAPPAGPPVAPPVALSPLLIDADCRTHLARQGLALSHRPAAGRRVQVKGAANENAAEDNHSLPAAPHPDLVALGAGLVAALGVRFAGLDLMAVDIARPPAEAGLHVGEVNANPGLHHHVLIAQPARRVPVAEAILEHLFTTGAGTFTP